MNENRGDILGVTFTPYEVFTAVGSKTESGVVVSKLAKGTMPVDFYWNNIKDSSNAEKIAEALKKILREKMVNVKNTCVAINSNMAFMKQISIDVGLDYKEIKEQVRWEFGQQLLEEPKNYSINLPKPTNIPRSGVYNQLIVAVKKEIVEFVKKIMNYAELEFKVLDVNTFAAETCLKYNYEIDNNEKIALVDVRSYEANITVIKNSEFFTFDIVPLSKNIEDKITEISVALKKIFNNPNVGGLKREKDFNKIYIYGAEASENILDGLHKKHQTEIELLQPFRKVKFAPELKDTPEWNVSQQFVESVGLVVRKI
jgi:Tfp pilus assembly PilM family ATPase